MNKHLKARVRKQGRTTAEAAIPNLKALSFGSTYRLGKWAHFRPSMSDGVADALTFDELYELDCQWLDAARTVLTPLGWTAIIEGTWLEGELVFARKGNHNA